MMPHRARLPNRRPAVTHHLETAGPAFVATVGFDDQAQPREIFIGGGKEGSAINTLLSDAAVIISVALQHGIEAEALARSISRLPADKLAPLQSTDQEPASPLGAVLDLLRSLETA